jgi:hypothetical protein
VQTGLPGIGMVVVLGAVFFVRENFPLQLAMVAFGLFLVAGSIWKGTEQVLPSERHSHALRVEVNQFLELVEQLNTAALAAKIADSATEQLEFIDIRRAMQQAVERMVEVAGKTDAELAEELADPVSNRVHQGFDSKHEA